MSKAEVFSKAVHEPMRPQEDAAVFVFDAPEGVGWRVVPTTLRRANDFVACHHRHTGRTARNGGKFAIALAHDGVIKGVAIVGNPLSATLMNGLTAEVLRVCVIPDTPRGSCSQLYGACWRAWKAMGGTRMITYTLEDETGASLKGAGWHIAGKTKPCKEGWRKGEDNCDRTHTPVMALVKNRWQVLSEKPKSSNLDLVK